MFNNSKYGNLLTVILVVAIIAIIGIIGIIGYRVYKAYYIETGAMQAATQFENSVSQENTNNIIQSGITNIEDTFDDEVSDGSEQITTYKGFAVVGTIQIPAINLKYPILEKNSKKSLETSVVLMYTSNGVNEIGNTVIIGHNYRNGTMFSNVDKLEKGDIIYITDTQGRKVKYSIYSIYRTSGSDSKYITRNTEGKREISLSTCTDDSKARTIVLARED
jgi:sortase A